MLPAFGEQRRKNECAERYRQNAGLGRQNSFVNRETGIAKNADAECGRPNNRKSDDECGGCSEDRTASGCQPQQHRKQHRNRYDRPPKTLREVNDEAREDCTELRAPRSLLFAPAASADERAAEVNSMISGATVTIPSASDANQCCHVVRTGAAEPWK